MSLDVNPCVLFSSMERFDAHPGKTRDNTLYAPINERIPFTLSGGVHAVREVIRWEVALMVPCSQHQPRITVVLGTMMVFAGDKRRLQDLRISRTLCQLLSSSSGVCPPQNKSSANFANAPLHVVGQQNSAHKFLQSGFASGHTHS